MNVRIAKDALRIRLDRDDLASLEHGATIEVGVAALDPAGGRHGVVCRLAADAEPAARVSISGGLMLVQVTRGDLDRLRSRDIEALEFSQDSPGGRSLVCRVEKDRRAFGAAARGAS